MERYRRDRRTTSVDDATVTPTTNYFFFNVTTIRDYMVGLKRVFTGRLATL